MAILEGTQWSIISDKCANIWGNFGEVGSQSTKIEQYVRFTHRTFFFLLFFAHCKKKGGKNANKYRASAPIKIRLE